MTWYRRSNQKYLGNDVTAIVYQFPASDASNAFAQLGSKGRKALECMNKIHFAGKVDIRTYLLTFPFCIFSDILRKFGK